MEETKLVAFTFDDGPVQYAEDSTAMNILRTLQKYGQRATFFYVGQQMNEENKKEIEFAQSIGCEAGNHTFTHCFLTEHTEEEVKEEYAKTTKLLEEYTGKAPKLVRNPYLAQNATVIGAVEYPMISCSVDSRDWAHISTEEIIARIMDAEAKGKLENAVVLLHEPYETTMRAVEYLIPTLMEKGYRFVTVSELAEHNGIELEKHRVYRKIVAGESVGKRKNFGAKSYCYPQPVFIIGTYDEEGKPDAMNAAWGGISEEAQISICLGPEHKTVKNILARKAFTVSMADAAHVVACDYVGIVSANDEPDKFAKADFNAMKSEFVDAPLIEELPMALECKFVSYDEESCCMIGEIVNVSADERVLDENGKIDVRKLQPIVYDPVNYDYLTLGEKVGNAFKDGTKLK